MALKVIIGSVAALAIIGVCCFLLPKSSEEKGEHLLTSASEALGQRAAEEVAQLLGNKGQIAVFSLDIQPREIPNFDAEMRIFSQTLKKHGVTIAATKLMPGGLNMLMLGKTPSVKDYEELLDQAPGAGALVSFVGLANLRLDDYQGLQAKSPPLIVVDTFGVMKGAGLSDLFQAKLVALALVPLTPAEVEMKKQQPNLFDRNYKILRAP